MEDEERLLPTGEEEEGKEDGDKDEDKEREGGEQIRARAKWKDFLIGYYGAVTWWLL